MIAGNKSADLAGRAILLMGALKMLDSSALAQQRQDELGYAETGMYRFF